MKILEFKNNILKNIYKKEFKKSGFNISGTNFIKKEKGFYKVFNFQSSQFNSSEFCSYYINIGLYFNEAFDFHFSNFYKGVEFEKPKKITIANCQYKWSANDILKTQNGYDINTKTDKSKFTSNIEREIIENFIPFFDSLKDLKSCLDFLSEQNSNSSEKVFVGLTYASLNQNNKAKEIINEYIIDIKPKDSIKSKIEKALEKRGLILKILKEEEKVKEIDFSKGSYP